MKLPPIVPDARPAAPRPAAGADARDVQFATALGAALAFTPPPATPPTLPGMRASAPVPHGEPAAAANAPAHAEPAMHGAIQARLELPGAPHAEPAADAAAEPHAAGAAAHAPTLAAASAPADDAATSTAVATARLAAAAAPSVLAATPSPTPRATRGPARPNTARAAEPDAADPAPRSRERTGAGHVAPASARDARPAASAATPAAPPAPAPVHAAVAVTPDGGANVRQAARDTGRGASQAPASPAGASAEEASRAATAGGRVARVTVAFEDSVGGTGRLRVMRRGDQVRATIVTEDHALARRLDERLNDLRGRLAERGLPEAELSIHTPRGDASAKDRDARTRRDPNDASTPERDAQRRQHGAGSGRKGRTS